MNTRILKTGMGRALSVMAVLSMSMFAACDTDDPASAIHDGKRALMSLGGTEGRSFLNLDASEVSGYLKVSVGDATDSRWRAMGMSSSLMAIGGGASGGPLRILDATANGVALQQKGPSNNILVNDAPNSQIVPGSPVNWNVMMDQGVHFNGSIDLPVLPRITNLPEYTDRSKNAGLAVNWMAGNDPGAEATISVTVDPVLTREEGGDVTQLNRDLGHTMGYTTTGSDNGQLQIPASQLANFPTNVFVRVSVMTFSYKTLLRSDGARFGLLALAQHTVPIKLVP